MRIHCLLPLATIAALAVTAQAKESSVKTVAEATSSMEHRAGLIALDWDRKTGRLHLEVPLTQANSTHSAQYLYAQSLPYGTGQNDLGLDRGQYSSQSNRIIQFERYGNKLLMVQPNLMYRTTSDDAAEQLAVKQSFPQSVLAGFTIEAESDDHTVLVDATDYFLHDAHGITERLSRAKQGNYSVDANRSAIFMESSKAFPRNTEVEAMLTFATNDASSARLVDSVTPDAHALTVHERHSFVALPPDGYTPRRFSPRAGYFDTSYRDVNVPLGEDVTQRFLERHRLIKKDPSCKAKCEAVAPIQYYVDRGAPEPIRTALLEGARWWDDAFQAAGWAPGTFRVDLLPADADPMDVRYNLIEWVHRLNRGWSYGHAVIDPRTGEIIKGTVTLGSLRGRQDYLIAEALLAPYTNGAAPTDAAHDPMLQMTLMRIRQLAAHETGHTLGLAHNFIASSFSTSPDQTVSVMDYPHPWITLDANGKPDLSHAYSVGIGTWDKVAIDYGYRDFTNEQEAEVALNNILTKSEKSGLVFISDSDARPFGGAQPHAHLWDNGADPAEELNRILKIREVALARFGPAVIRNGMAMSQMEETLVPLYLLHRYQTEAAIKEIGGLDYRYQVRGDGQMSPKIVEPALQQKALQAVLRTLEPQTLTLPESLLAQFPPVPEGYARTGESFPSHTGLTFDPIAAAESSADLTLEVLFDPSRASRLIEYHMRVPQSPSLRGVMEAVSKTTAERPEGGHSMSSEVERAVEFRGLEAMMSLAKNTNASSQARAIARSHLNDLLYQWTTQAAPDDTAEAIHRAAMIDRLKSFANDPEKFVPARQVTAPPGMPIGEEDFLTDFDR